MSIVRVVYKDDLPVIELVKYYVNTSQQISNNPDDTDDIKNIKQILSTYTYKDNKYYCFNENDLKIVSDSLTQLGITYTIENATYPSQMLDKLSQIQGRAFKINILQDYLNK